MQIYEINFCITSPNHLLMCTTILPTAHVHVPELSLLVSLPVSAHEVTSQKGMWYLKIVDTRFDVIQLLSIIY